MRSWMKRVRGAIGMGLTWATAWLPVGAVVGWTLGLFFTGARMGQWAALFTALGFVGGTIFSSVLRLAEGRRRFDELSMPRFAAWGALGGLLLGGLAVAAGVLGPGLSLVDLVTVTVTTAMGAGSAAGTLALARLSDDQELLDTSSEVADVGLSSEEARRLLT